MKYGCYSVKDLKTGFLPPTYDVNDLAAERNFDHACSNPDSLFFTHPGDYQLWKVGEFDTDSGIFEVEQKFLMDAPEREKKKGKK